MPLKVMTIVGTRPELIKLSRVIAELEERTEHTLVHTGQNYDYELNQIFFQELGIKKPDHFLDAAGDSAAATIANVIAGTDGILQALAPDALLVLGDTNSCLSTLAAKKRKIPVFHMEAGNRCFDSRVPEELNRKLVDHMSDINLTYSEHARRYLLAEGIRPDTVIHTGSPMREVLDFYQAEIAESGILRELGLSSGEYFVVSAHREENVDDSDSLLDLCNSLNAIADKYQVPIIFSTHPRTRKRLENLEGFDFSPLIQFMKPLGFFDYVKLQSDSKCVISDSGTLTEESALLDFPAVTIREAHERPEGMDQGTLIMSGLKLDSVLDSIELVLAHAHSQERSFAIPPAYEPTDVSRKVARIIMSYTGYVNRTVWRQF